MDHTIRVSSFVFCKYFYLFTNQENLLFSLKLVQFGYSSTPNKYQCFPWTCNSRKVHLRFRWFNFIFDIVWWFYIWHCLNKFTGLGLENFWMYTDLERSHVSCDVSYLLGPISLVVLFRRHSEGEESFLIYIITSIWKYEGVQSSLEVFTSLKSRSGLLHQLEPLKWFTLILKNMYVHCYLYPCCLQFLYAFSI